MPHTIECTVDNCRTHLSFDGLHIGDVDSYNNCFTKFFAWIFGWAVYVTINGKEKAFSKDDYAKWIREHTDRIEISTNDLHEFTNLCLLNIRRPADGSSPMSHNLSYGKTQFLYEKMVRCLVSGNFDKAYRYAAKGASLNHLFWNSQEHGLSFGDMRSHLSFRRIPPTAFCRYTPFIYALSNNCAALAALMRRCGANTQLQGEVVHFERTNLGVTHQSNLEVNNTLATHRRRPYVIGNTVIPRRGLHVESHLDIRTTVTSHFQDIIAKQANLVYNAQTNAIDEEQVQEAPRVISIDRTEAQYVSRLV